MWRDSAVSSGVAGLPVKLAEVPGDKLEATSRGTDEAHRDLAARMRDRDLAEILSAKLIDYPDFLEAHPPDPPLCPPLHPPARSAALRPTTSDLLGALTQPVSSHFGARSCD